MVKAKMSRVDVIRTRVGKIPGVIIVPDPVQLPSAVDKAPEKLKVGEVCRPGRKTRYLGCSVGRDKNGWFVATHRCRSKSYPSPERITLKDIKFIDSTG
jgi:hypothetical protein